MELEKSYDASKTEGKIYQTWLDSGYFNPDNLPGERKEPYTIIMPPPNVTGTLHIGHALFATIQDILIRYQRMQGKKALWLPGTDHAAIATQSKVEAELYKKEKKTRFDFPREEFLKLVENYAQTSHDIIIGQLKRLGASADWSREAYTLDEQRNLAVRTAFKNMYVDEIIYRGARIVNWDPKLKTTVSDDEIEYVEQKDPFFHFKYGPFTIGTVRPETKFGDKYVVMHPKDERYKQYKHGQKIELEWINGPLTATIIKDEAADMEFGSGVMTITPAHSAIDFEIAKRHGLDIKQVIDERGCLLAIAGDFEGQHIKKARAAIVEKLKTKGLLVKTDEGYLHNVSTNSRGGGIIEPQIKEQWFIDVNKEFSIKHSEIAGIQTGQMVTLKQLMRHMVQEGLIKIIPEHFEKIYFHWIDNLRDWCISRQIWYGHQIPVWYKKIDITYFVHGTTTDNEEKKSSGHYDADLSELGKEQSNQLKEAVKEQKFDIVFCSDLQRARKTAETAFGDKTEIIFDSRLREINYGELTRQNEGKVSAMKSGAVEKPFPKGESYRDVEKRIKNFLEEILKKYPNKKIAIVAHQGPQLALDVLIKKLTWQEAFANDWRNTKAWQAGWEYKLNEIFCDVNPPTGEGWTQDSDTLDTWFSSGLWTFSTLGWPSSAKASDFAKTTSDKSEGKPDDLSFYHPTDVMETGYDILFFWVARMILMSTYHIGQIPFKTVYLHGLVRDKDRQKMSKSKGNVIDPLGVIDTFGTDALRFALIFSSAVGNDIPLSEDKIKGMKHFANKLWNIARFVLANMGSQELRIMNYEYKPLTKADEEIIDALKFAVDEVTEGLENFQLHAAAQKIYQFTWHSFADIYIEASKQQLVNPEQKENTQVILLNSLLIILELLHPFMPFITEEIWSKLNQKDLLMVTKWPASPV